MGFSHANLFSILIAAVAAWIFGGAYYSALSKPWMAAQGKTLEQCKAEMEAKSGFAKGAPFVLVFISEIIIAWVLYGILLHLNVFTLRAGIISALFCWFRCFGERQRHCESRTAAARFGEFDCVDAVTV